jgi:DNA-binding HxlR family transcriptional regulator
MKAKNEYECPFEYALSIISGKWKGLVIFYLGREGVVRFAQLQRLIPGITQKMLTQSLRILEREGIVHRKVYPVVPPKVEYRLTSKGESLLPILDELQKWGDRELNV